MTDLTLPDIVSLRLEDTKSPRYPLQEPEPEPKDQYEAAIEKHRLYTAYLPYSIEPNSDMQKYLDFIIRRIVICVEAKDYDVGFFQWDSILTYWMTLKYPIPTDRRVLLAKLYFHLATTPGMSTQLVATAADTVKALIGSKKKVTIKDMRLPWKPIYTVLSQDLFLSRRQFEYTQLSWCMGYLADICQRFFHPDTIGDMLSTFTPLMNGTDLDSLLSSQYYLLTFLPTSHPQSYLPMLFRVWESINSYLYDERMIYFLAKLAEMHVNPSLSDPRKVLEILDDERSEDEHRPPWGLEELGEDDIWPGLYKDVGIFTDHEWHLLMCKCLASMEIPLADTGSLTTGPTADRQAGFENDRLPKPGWRIPALAKIIVYSMAPDGLPAPSSNMMTPFGTPLASGAATPLTSGMTTPMLGSHPAHDYLSQPLFREGRDRIEYLAGSKALDALAKMIASTESFFHPSNSGAWTSDLCAFIKYIAYEFNKRWHEEQKLDCKTPRNRRLTRTMKRELVKCLRTVALLALFSQDSSTVSNIQSCLKSMSVMEPDLVLQPILERAIPSLEALVETQRTISVIKGLGSVVPALVSRSVYYPGAKHLVSILELLIPGIDLNDPSKTLCTAAFLADIAQYVKFGDATTQNGTAIANGHDEYFAHKGESHLTPANGFPSLPTLSTPQIYQMEFGEVPRLSDAEEDAALRDTTTGFADWVANIIRRIIQLLENLPDEGADGSVGGSTETQVIESVASACSQICVHLSDNLFDMVLNIIYDYASTNARSNVARAIHQLVECLSNANPVKTLAKFFAFCKRNITVELENGASSLRTTSNSRPLPSDATLHWSLAILRGSVYNDGTAVLKYKDEMIPLLKMLRDKTYSKRGFSWTGKLLSSMLLTLTHTYPLENKFMNPDEWNSPEFKNRHYLYWGKLYKPEDIKISWHIPNEQEIEFALDVFRELVEPTLVILDKLLEPGVTRDAVWRNDFCRYLSFVRNAFSGIPTLTREVLSHSDQTRMAETSDILNDIPEMIAHIEPVNSGFCLADPSDPRHRYITSLRQRFGSFLHKASLSLSQQGEENTVDAVQMLIRSIRTYLLDYGDSRDSYHVNESQYNSEKTVASQYAKQKEWPRSVFVRRARLMHSARLQLNSIERRRGPLEDSLIDNLAQWAIWNYAVVRQSSQGVLDSICSTYDGVRKRCLPILYKALGPNSDDDRVKGALWTMNSPHFSKYIVSEPTLACELFKHLFGCQDKEKPSIQDAVSVVFDNCLNSFLEPSYVVYDMKVPEVDESLMKLKNLVSLSDSEKEILRHCDQQRRKRVKMMNEGSLQTFETILEIGKSTKTHWKYTIVAVRCLRTLVRRDLPLRPDHIEFFLEKLHDTHSSIRYYAQRATMKSLRNIKLRTYCKTPADLVLARSENPLHNEIFIDQTPQALKDNLQAYGVPLRSSHRKVAFMDKGPAGWLVTDGTLSGYSVPDEFRSTFQPWEAASQGAVDVVRRATTQEAFWKKLSGRYSEENHQTTVTQDNISCVKSIFQLLEDEPWPALQPIVVDLLNDKDKDKQRAAAELCAGVLNGSKHWPLKKQEVLWNWFEPFMKVVWKQNLKTDTMSIWVSFFEYMFYHKDPRRLQPLVDYVLQEFKTTDYNGESSFEATKILSLLRATYEQLNWKFTAFLPQVIDRIWKEKNSDHIDVRAHVAEVMAFSSKISWVPKLSQPTIGCLIKESKTLPLDYDIMGIRGYYHKSRVNELVAKFKEWREERGSGPRAFQSTYDRVGITICRWLFQSIHDVDAVATFDYILPLMPELFRFTELNDNDELAMRASTLLVRMCGVTPPTTVVKPILTAIFDAILKSPSWRLRLKAMPLVQVFYFRQMPSFTETKVTEVIEILCQCLDDEIVEVREMAATTLSGVLRLSPRRSILKLKDRFVKLAKRSLLPPRTSPGYNKAIRDRHAAILGICALVDSYPYTVEKWMPELLTKVLAEHAYDPIPISTTIRKCASNFKRTHQDTWHEDSKRFNEVQLSNLATLLAGTSYYA